MSTSTSETNKRPASQDIHPDRVKQMRTDSGAEVEQQFLLAARRVQKGNSDNQDRPSLPRPATERPPSTTRFDQRERDSRDDFRRSSVDGQVRGSESYRLNGSFRDSRLPYGDSYRPGGDSRKDRDRSSDRRSSPVSGDASPSSPRDVSKVSVTNLPARSRSPTRGTAAGASASAKPLTAKPTIEQDAVGSTPSAKEDRTKELREAAVRPPSAPSTPVIENPPTPPPPPQPKKPDPPIRSLSTPVNSDKPPSPPPPPSKPLVSMPDTSAGVPKSASKNMTPSDLATKVIANLPDVLTAHKKHAEVSASLEQIRQHSAKQARLNLAPAIKAAQQAKLAEQEGLAAGAKQTLDNAITALHGSVRDACERMTDGAGSKPSADLATKDDIQSLQEQVRQLLSRDKQREEKLVEAYDWIHDLEARSEDYFIKHTGLSAAFTQRTERIRTLEQQQREHEKALDNRHERLKTLEKDEDSRFSVKTRLDSAEDKISALDNALERAKKDCEMAANNARLANTKAKEANDKVDNIKEDTGAQILGLVKDVTQMRKVIPHQFEDLKSDVKKLKQSVKGIETPKANSGANTPTPTTTISADAVALSLKLQKQIDELGIELKVNIAAVKDEHASMETKWANSFSKHAAQSNATSAKVKELESRVLPTKGESRAPGTGLSTRSLQSISSLEQDVKDLKHEVKTVKNEAKELKDWPHILLQAGQTIARLEKDVKELKERPHISTQWSKTLRQDVNALQAQYAQVGDLRKIVEEGVVDADDVEHVSLVRRQLRIEEQLHEMDSSMAEKLGEHDGLFKDLRRDRTVTRESTKEPKVEPDSNASTKLTDLVNEVKAIQRELNGTGSSTMVNGKSQKTIYDRLAHLDNVYKQMLQDQLEASDNGYSPKHLHSKCQELSMNVSELRAVDALARKDLTALQTSTNTTQSHESVSPDSICISAIDNLRIDISNLRSQHDNFREDVKSLNLMRRVVEGTREDVGKLQAQVKASTPQPSAQAKQSAASDYVFLSTVNSIRDEVTQLRMEQQSMSRTVASLNGIRSETAVMPKDLSASKSKSATPQPLPENEAQAADTGKPNSLKDELAGLSAQVFKMQEQIDGVKSRMNTLLTDNAQPRAVWDRLDSLRLEVTSLSNKLDPVSKDVSALKLKSNSSNLSGVNTPRLVSSVQPELAPIKNDLTRHVDKQMQEGLSKFQPYVAALQQNVATLRSDLQTIANRVVAAESMGVRLTAVEKADGIRRFALQSLETRYNSLNTNAMANQILDQLRPRVLAARDALYQSLQIESNSMKLHLAGLQDALKRADTELTALKETQTQTDGSLTSIKETLAQTDKDLKEMDDNVKVIKDAQEATPANGLSDAELDAKLQNWWPTEQDRLRTEWTSMLDQRNDMEVDYRPDIIALRNDINFLKNQIRELEQERHTIRVRTPPHDRNGVIHIDEDEDEGIGINIRRNASAMNGQAPAGPRGMRGASLFDRVERQPRQAMTEVPEDRREGTRTTPRKKRRERDSTIMD